MKLKRLKTGQKRRWKKGHSCASNPEITKFRDAAKGNFFKKLGESSGLTSEALAEHNAALPSEPQLCADAEDDKTIGRTFKTFATNYTTCTIPAFEKFFKNFSIDSDLQKRMLAIHATAQEYLQEVKLAESSTSYMCALMISLEGVQESEEDVAATLALLAKVIRKVAKEVLATKFAEYSKLLEDILKTYSTSTNTKLIINAIGSLSVLLRSQQEIQWSYASTMNLFHMVMCYTTHENADIRKSAQYNVSAILKGSFLSSDKTGSMEDEESDMDVEREEKGSGAAGATITAHPAAQAVGNFIKRNLKLASQNLEGNASLYLLIFLQSVINCLPQKILEECCSIVLGLMHIGNNVINSRSLKVFGTIFSSEAHQRVDSAALTQQTVEALINALTSNCDTQNSRSLKLVPGMNNPELNTIWMDVVAAGIIRLSRKDESLGIERLALWMKQLTLFWKSDYEHVREKVWHVIDYIFDECIKPLGDEKMSSYAPILLQSFKHVEHCLSLQYESAWPYIFRSLSLYFWILGSHCIPEMVPCLKNLSSMVETPDIRGKKQLEETIGAAINGMGPEAVMNVIPLEITGDIREDEVHFWVLPIVKKYVKESRLAFFSSYFVPLANKCFVIVKRLKEKGQMESIIAKTYQQIERQIWALLPSFADVAVDIEGALSIQIHAVDAEKDDFITQSFAQLIGNHIKSREDTRLDFMAALRNMLKCTDASKAFAHFSKNFLPILFNVYLMKPRDKFPKLPTNDVIDNGQRLAAYTTIKTYLPLIPADKISIFFNLSIKKFLDETEDMFKKKCLLNLTSTFVPFISEVSLSEIFNNSKIYIETKNAHLQKSAYRTLEDICCADSEASNKFMKEHAEEIGILLLTSSEDVVPNARAPRLKCLLEYLPFLPSDIPGKKSKPFFKQLVLESVTYCGRKNSSSTRKSAFALLREVGEAVHRIKKTSFEISFDFCYKLLPSLTPPSDMTSNTILALMALSYLYDDMLDTKIALRSLEEISQLLSSNDRDVIKSCLAFIRVVFAQYSRVLLSDFVDKTVRSIVQMPPKDRYKFRLKIRDIFASLIRKFGADRIMELVPKDDTIQKVLVNIVKKDSRKKRTKKDEEESEDEDDGYTAEAPTSLDQVLEELYKEIENDEETKTTKRKKPKTKGQGKRKDQIWIKEDEDEIVDLLDLNSAHNLMSRRPKLKRLRFKEEIPLTEEEKYGFKIDRETNKFIIREGRERKEKGNNDDDEDFMMLGDLAGVLPKKRKHSDSEEQTLKRKRTPSEDGNTDKPATKQMAGGSGRTIPKKKFDYGGEFRAKKAGGDISKKGGVAPYAYVQLSREKLNKRKKAKFAGQFKSLVKGAKRGAAKGSKVRSRKR